MAIDKMKRAIRRGNTLVVLFKNSTRPHYIGPQAFRALKAEVAQETLKAIRQNAHSITIA